MEKGARYRVQTVERTTGRSGRSTWTLTFLRIGSTDDTIQLTLHSAAFLTFDLDGVYHVDDLMQLAKKGGRER